MVKFEKIVHKIKLNAYVFIAVILVLLFSSCKTKVHYVSAPWSTLGLCYVETDKGRLWGIGNKLGHTLEPQYDTIINVLDNEAMLLEKDGGYYLYTMGDKFLCDTAMLVNIPIFSSEYSGDGIYGKYAKISTKKGIYGCYKVFHTWAIYGPFEEYVPGVSGYMFKDKHTGKWGVGRYGKWEDYNKSDVWYYLDKWELEPSDEIMLTPKFDKIICLWDFYEYETHVILGYKERKDIKWYCYDGNKWSGFDIDGNPIKVEENNLSMALAPTPQKNKKRNQYGNFYSQRLGIEHASVYMKYHKKY